MSTARQLLEALNLVEVSGPFISLSILAREFPNGLNEIGTGAKKDLRITYETWLNKPEAKENQYIWVNYILNNILEFPENLIGESQMIPPNLFAFIPEINDKIRPDFCLLNSESNQKAEFLIKFYDRDQKLDRPVKGERWKMTPISIMTKLLHNTGVELGLITNGDQWMVVYARPGEVSGFATWYSSVWFEEPNTLLLFYSLFHTHRFFGVAEENTIVSLLKESVTEQQEVTIQLGSQVREAVKTLIHSLNYLENSRDQEILSKIQPQELYDAALTIMMRLVFLLFAEERGLLHLGIPIYDENYAISTLQQQLQETADKSGEEILERRYDAWLRLLATFRAVHGGVAHQDLQLQAYGGSLFDPNQFPFLEGLTSDSSSSDVSSEPLEINNRVVLHLLNSLQLLRTKIPGTNSYEPRRVSFHALGIEQIGQVYEGLLEYKAIRAEEVLLGISGIDQNVTMVSLLDLENKHQEGEEILLSFIRRQTGSNSQQFKMKLRASEHADIHKLRLACKNNSELVDRIKPYSAFLKLDTFERLIIVLPNDIYVTGSTTRSSTGTHYTPKNLTETVVQYTLEPLIYEGVSEGQPRNSWKLKSEEEILRLRICDPAMGSGAFLVQTCRYLAERLVEAWEYSEDSNMGGIIAVPEGKPSKGEISERLIPKDQSERILVARRLIADNCLFGVDINAMAVEMAKLSIWLITVDVNQPFTFLDHAFKCGDTLFGVTSMDQINSFSFCQSHNRQSTFATLRLNEHFIKSIEDRELLVSMPSNSINRIKMKEKLNKEANDAIKKSECI